MDGKREAEIELHHPLHKGEIRLDLDSYDDIFSDFDPRHYAQKALSVDFIEELRRASMDKEHGLEISMLVPKKKRNHAHEATIKERLSEHFSKHLHLARKEKSSFVRRGIMFILGGIMLMFFAAIILTKEETGLLLHVLLILLEPGGWFLFWEGLNQIVFESKKTKPDLDFYRKMSRAKIEFISY